MHRKPFFAALLCVTGAALATASLHAQAVPSATARQFSVTVGATGSLFQPDYLGGTSASTNGQSILYGIDGPGAYIDLRFRRWVQLEAEGRWLRFNDCTSPSASGNCNVNTAPEDNYFAGPRFPFRFGRFTPYAKFLGGRGVTKLQNAQGLAGKSLSGYALAYGGGTDYRLNKHLSLRLIDFEYQEWFLTAPANGSAAASSFNIKPYGASAGISYKIF
jgi:opacity protein-like surface antigen